MATTIKDIARIAGVTHSTVSRCLNDKPGVSDSMRVEIKKIAKELNFEFNANARGLNTSKTGTIGIILDDENDDNSPHFYTKSFLRHIRHQLEEEDLDTLTTFSRNNISGKDNIIKLVNRRKVDGIIILSPKISLESISFLKENEIPFIFSHQIPNKELGDVNAVYCDHYHGGYLATRHLLEKGRKNILCLSRFEDRFEFTQRTRGYETALMEYGLSVKKKNIIKGNASLEVNSGLWRKIEPEIHRIDAVFAHTDLMAVVLMKELKDHGISIPDDIAIVGYDNIELCTFVDPHLTSIAQPSKDISEKTCEILIRLLSGHDDSKRIIIPPSLIIREST